MNIKIICFDNKCSICLNCINCIGCSENSKFLLDKSKLIKLVENNKIVIE